MQNPAWLQRNEHFSSVGGGDNNSHGLFNATMSANAIKSRQAMTAVDQHIQQQQQQNGHFAVLRVRPGGNNIHPSNKSAIITKSSPPQRATQEGISIGTLSTAVFHCNNDPMVSPEHGTLECTSKHGVWVYVDHSTHGTKLNNSRRILKEAVVVRTGDRLLVGNTEIELHFETSSGDDAQRRNDAPSKHLGGRQHAHAQGSSNNQTGIAPSPITWPATSGEGARKVDHFKIEKPKIVTSGDSFTTPTPLEYIASPIPSSYSRRKRHSMTAFTPSPPGGGSLGNQNAGSNPLIYHRTRPLVPSAPSTPPRLDATRPFNISPHQPHGMMKWRTNQPEGDDNNSNNNNDTEDSVISNSRSAKPGRFTSTPPPPPPPPLSYSSSPATALPIAQRMQQSHLPQNPSPPLVPQQHQRLHTEAPKSSQRDNLRIQVSKKMAGYQAAVESKRATGKSDISGGRPIPGSLKIPLPSTPPPLTPSSTQANNNQLDFTPPSSPVAHKDILRQKESLLNILKNKYKEEQLLKQQQEEWMRHNFNLASPPMSPIKSGSKHKSANRDDDGVGVANGEGDNAHDDGATSDLEIPSRAPVLLRTISLGIHQASPRLTAAVLASRARVDSFDDKRSNQRSPRTVNTNLSQESADFFSVSSSVSTEPACHRRVTRSLSISSSEDLVSSAEIGDFMGYEEEVGDDMTSFTTHGFYSSDDCKSNSKDDSMRQFSSSSSSMYYTSGSSSSLQTGGVDPPPSHHDRYSIDIVTLREPEDDDEVHESPKKSRTDSFNSPHLMRKAESTPNLFSDVQKSPPVYKSVVRRYSRVKDPSPIEVAGGSASSPAVARRFRRLPSPV